jgi:hypothetical protein
MEDLFESLEKQPIELQNLFLEYFDVETYEECEELLAKTEELGYTFDYDLSATPFDLQKLPPPQ